MLGDDCPRNASHKLSDDPTLRLMQVAFLGLTLQVSDLRSEVQSMRRELQSVRISRRPEPMLKEQAPLILSRVLAGDRALSKPPPKGPPPEHPTRAKNPRPRGNSKSRRKQPHQSGSSGSYPLVARTFSSLSNPRVMEFYPYVPSPVPPLNVQEMQTEAALCFPSIMRRPSRPISQAPPQDTPLIPPYPSQRGRDPWT